MSTGFETHALTDSDQERRRKNTANVHAYFSQLAWESDSILHVAAGENVSPGALSEDIEIQPNGEPALLVKVGESLAQYLPVSKLFAKVYVVNARNPKLAQKDYLWTFEVSKPVLQSGGVLIIVGVDESQRSI